MTALPPGTSSAMPPAPHSCPTCGRCPTCGSVLPAPVVAKPDHRLGIIAAVVAAMAILGVGVTGSSIGRTRVPALDNDHDHEQHDNDDHAGRDQSAT